MTAYKKLDQIPLHCFSNKECTKTPSPDLKEYLRFMLTNHPNDLEYLWRYTQQFVKYGGCYMLTFEAWLTKLTKDLQQQE